jgi:hypothetical protein
VTTARRCRCTVRPPGAATETVVTRTPVSEVASLVCVSEPVLLTGVIQTTFHATQDAGGGVTFTQTSAYVDVVGIGQMTGQNYRVVGQPFGNLVFLSGETFPITEARVTTALIIGQGPANPGPAFSIQILEKFTINANGTVTAEVVQIRQECLLGLWPQSSSWVQFSSTGAKE